MTTSEPQETNGVDGKPVRRRPAHGARMHLPFENRHKDAGEWAYDHRAGLSVMIICYLLLAIAFVGSKIILNDKPQLQGIYIDLQDLETLAEAEAILDQGRAESSDDNVSEGQDTKFKGNVTVSFVLKDPVRTKRHIVVPAYRCEGGGEVVVAITVNRGGEVTAAKVVSGGDESMREAALDAAWKSLFNIDMSAPERHNGTITYLFIPQ